MPVLAGQKVLITGATGQVAGPVTVSLAAANEVWATARFKDADKRQQLEERGIRCEPSDFDAGDFSSLPQDFDYVLNFGVAKPPDFDTALRANGEGVGLLMRHCQRAKAFLHCSTTGVYEAAGHTEFSEDSPLGDNHRVMMPTYSIAKITAETVARFAARVYELPTIIARLNAPYGSSGGWPYFHLLMMKEGVPIPVHTTTPSRYTLFHEDDICRTVPGMLAAASVPAPTINWCGQEHVAIQEWCAYLGELTGLAPAFEETDQTIDSVMSSNQRMQQLVGPAQVPWRDGIRRMVETLHPDWLVG